MSALFYRLYYPCDRIRDFAYDYLEGKLTLAVSIRFHMHLRGCPQCREYLALYRLAANPAAFLKENPPPRELLDHTLEFLEKQGLTDGPEGGEPR